MNSYTILVTWYEHKPGDRLKPFKGPIPYKARLTNNDIENLVFLTDVDILTQSDEFRYIGRLLSYDHDWMRDLHNFNSGIATIKITDVAYVGGPSVYEVGRVPLEDDAYAFMSHELIDYFYNYKTRAWEANYTSDYIRDNYKPRACLYTLVIDMWYDAFRKHKKKHPLLTYDALYKIIHGVNPTADSTWELSLDTLRDKFLIPNKLSLKVIDIECKIIWQYIAPTEQKQISPNPGYMVLHNNHVYRITTNARVLAQLYRTGNTDVDINVPSDADTRANKTTSFYIPKYNDKAKVGLIDGLDDLKDIMAEDETFAVGKTKNKRKLATNDLNQLLADMIAHDHFEPKTYLNADTKTISKIVFNTQHTEFTIIRPMYPSVGDTPFTSSYQYERFLYHQREIANAVMNNNTKSYYSESLLAAIKNYRRGAVWGYFDEHKHHNTAIDGKKWYTSCLMQIKNIPVTDVFTEWQPYDPNVGIDVKNFYLVQVNNSTGLQRILLNHDEEFVSGYLVKMALATNVDIKIKSELKPPKFVPNTVSNAIKAMYADDVLTIQHKKDNPNIIIGQCTKKYQNSIKSHLFASDDERKNFYDDGYPVRLSTSNTGNTSTSTYHVGMERTSTLLHDGFYLIGLLVYDIARIKMFAMAVDASKYANVIGIKTDCLFLDGDLPPMG